MFWKRFVSKKVVKCSVCNKEESEKVCIRFADFWYCSEECMTESFKNMNTIDLLIYDKKDREMRKN